MGTQSVTLTREQREAHDTRRNFYQEIAEKAAKLAADAYARTKQQELKNAPPMAPTPAVSTAQMGSVQTECDVLAVATDAEVVPQKQRPTISNIQRTVCRFYGVDVADWLSSSHKAHLVRARQVSMYLCRVLTGISYEEIGRRHRGRDHTTVISATRKIARLIGDTSIKQEQGVVISIDEVYVKEVEALRELFLP